MSSSNLSIAIATSKKAAAKPAASDLGTNPEAPADEVVVEDRAPKEGVVKDTPADE